MSYEGDTLVLKASPAIANSVALSGEEPGTLEISDDAAHTSPADRCRQEDPKRAELGDGGDRLVVSHTAPAGPAVLGPRRRRPRRAHGDRRADHGDVRRQGRQRLAALRGRRERPARRAGSDTSSDWRDCGPGSDSLRAGASSDTLSAAGCAAPCVTGSSCA